MITGILVSLDVVKSWSGLRSLGSRPRSACSWPVRRIRLISRTPPSPVPEPFAGLLLEHLASRENTTTATNPNGAWLFPGPRAGQPLHPAALGKQLSILGITTLHARTATIRQLVLQAPPSVVAGMLSYHVVHTEAVAVQAGGTWKHYAPGDHTRSLPRVPQPRKPTT